MHVPWGKVNVRILKQRADATGVGPIVMCRSCREYMEVIAQ